MFRQVRVYITILAYNWRYKKIMNPFHYFVHVLSNDSLVDTVEELIILL